jgi:hypothetical protein
VFKLLVVVSCVKNGLIHPYDEQVNKRGKREEKRMKKRTILKNHHHHECWLLVGVCWRCEVEKEKKGK